jgi:hypothetical protein
MSPHFEDRTRVLISALGQKQTSRFEIAMSALPPKETGRRDWGVCFVPKADMET